MPSLDQCYQTLGVDTNADEEAIRRAFRRLACQTHPDLHPADPSAAHRFVRLSDAYHTILANGDGVAAASAQAATVPAIKPWVGIDVRIGDERPAASRRPSFADILSHYQSKQRH